MHRPVAGHQCVEGSFRRGFVGQVVAVLGRIAGEPREHEGHGSLWLAGRKGGSTPRRASVGGSNRYHFRRPDLGRVWIGGEHVTADQRTAPRSCRHVDG